MAEAKQGTDVRQAVTPPVRPELVEMWRNNLRKSQQANRPAGRRLDQESSINIVFDGAGAAPRPGMAGVLEIRFPCRIIGCHIFVGNQLAQPASATATIDLRIGTQGAWATTLTGSADSTSPIWAIDLPTIFMAAEADLSVLDWIVDLEPGDLLAYRLVTFTAVPPAVTGAGATWLAVSLPISKLEVSGTSTSPIVDASGDTLTLSDGTPLVIRG